MGSCYCCSIIPFSKEFPWGAKFPQRIPCGVHCSVVFWTPSQGSVGVFTHTQIQFVGYCYCSSIPFSKEFPCGGPIVPIEITLWGPLLHCYQDPTNALSCVHTTRTPLVFRPRKWRTSLFLPLFGLSFSNIPIIFVHESETKDNLALSKHTDLFC